MFIQPCLFKKENKKGVNCFMSNNLILKYDTTLFH